MCPILSANPVTVSAHQVALVQFGLSEDLRQFVCRDTESQAWMLLGRIPVVEVEDLRMVEVVVATVEALAAGGDDGRNLLST